MLRPAQTSPDFRRRPGRMTPHARCGKRDEPRICCVNRSAFLPANDSYSHNFMAENRVSPAKANDVDSIKDLFSHLSTAAV